MKPGNSRSSGLGSVSDEVCPVSTSDRHFFSTRLTNFAAVFTAGGDESDRQFCLGDPPAASTDCPRDVRSEHERDLPGVLRLTLLAWTSGSSVIDLGAALVPMRVRTAPPSG